MPERETIGSGAGLAAESSAVSGQRIPGDPRAVDAPARPFATVTGELPRPSELDARITRATRLVFWTAWASFLVGCAWFAAVNNQPGGWDSMQTLSVARNIAEGRGFVSDIVPNYVVPYALPGPEVMRAPGMPYLLAAVYRVFGVSLAAHVWLNALVVLLSAWLLRFAIRADGGDWWADLAGVAMLVVRAPLASTLNNGPLILATVAMLTLAVLSTRGRLVGVRLAIACALVTAVGVLMKQTFLLSGGACTILLLGFQRERPWRQRARDCAVFGVLVLLLTSPYWLTNLFRYGELFYSPINRFHLQTRYGLDPYYEHHRRVLFEVTPLTVGAFVDRIGIINVFRIELQFLRERVAAIALWNPLLLIPAMLGVLLVRRRDWRLYAAVATLTIGPMFDTTYWFVEPRYLLPLFPCLLFLGWLAARNYRAWARAAMRPGLASRVVAGFAVLLAGAAIYFPVMGWAPLRVEITTAIREPTPAWSAILQRLPSDAVVMSDRPPAVAWWASRRSIITPVGDRADLLTVLRMYRPGYYLDQGSLLAVPPLTAWAPGELEQIADGAGWSLHRINVRLTTDGDAGRPAEARPAAGLLSR